MIEASSLAEVEAALRAHGFFGGGAEGVAAEVYLGYRLSSALRRGLEPSPPEP